jgi:uncharacterized phiE125 gp8 family phage protein
MPLSLVQVTPPAVEPVGVDELKLHLRLDTSEQDTMLAMLLTAARQMLEETLWRQMIVATWSLHLDAWQTCIQVPRPPLANMVPTGQEPDLGIAYVDSAGMVQVLDPSTYQVDTASQPGRIQLTDLPALGTGLTPVTITYQAGYGFQASDVPAPLRQAILLFAADMYEHTEAQAETRLTENITVCRLIGPCRNLEMY